MPLYDYDCAHCGRRFEVIHGVHADGPTTCPLCGGGPVRKAITAPAVHFKGSGWAKKERRAGMKSSRSSSDGDGSSAGGSDDGAVAPAKAEATTSEGAKGEGAKGDGPKKDASKAHGSTSDRPKEAGTTASSSSD